MTQRPQPTLEGRLLGERVLVTGGAGYLGAHMCLALLERGAHVHVIDNLSQGSYEALRRVSALAPHAELSFTEGDVRDEALLTQLLTTHKLSSVIHFAGLKSVNESLERPLDYYSNNLEGSLSLMRAMKAAGVWRLIFSSSATVYGVPKTLPLTEEAPLSTINPYGQSKLMVEEVARDLARSDERWLITLLRYFNPVGAHPSGQLGEDPQGVPNNLAPYITQVLQGKRSQLQIFGDDYPTPDGTGVRDYLHVMDLIEGHLAALEAQLGLRGDEARALLRGEARAYNLGTGRGTSVRALVRAFEQVSGREVPCRVVARRSGDVASCYADPSRAERELGWRASRGVLEMARDAWRWQAEQPNGYPKPEQTSNKHTQDER